MTRRGERTRVKSTSIASAHLSTKADDKLAYQMLRRDIARQSAERAQNADLKIINTGPQHYYFLAEGSKNSGSMMRLLLRQEPSVKGYLSRWWCAKSNP